MCRSNGHQCREEKILGLWRFKKEKKIHIPPRGCSRRLRNTTWVNGFWSWPKAGRMAKLQMNWVLAAARLAFSGHSLLVQFDPVSIALLVWQTFVVGQDALYQEACRLVHVDVVLGKRRKYITLVILIVHLHMSFFSSKDWTNKLNQWCQFPLLALMLRLRVLDVHWNTLYDAFLEAAAGRQRWLLESQPEASRDEVKPAIYLLSFTPWPKAVIPWVEELMNINGISSHYSDKDVYHTSKIELRCI